MALSPDRLDRFARQIIIPEIGGAGQAALAKAHVAIIGIGGIGSPALQYLAGAGVGTLTLFDDDTVDASNLQRQMIYREADIGASKVEAAARWVHEFDSKLEVRTVGERLVGGNAARHLEPADVIIDGCDNFATRLAVSDNCVALGKPLVSAAVGRFQGQVGAFAGHREGQPCYRCFVGDAFDAEDCDTCAEDGMLGAMAGWTATFGAMHAIRVILEGVSTFGQPDWGKVHVLDGLRSIMRPLKIAKDPECKGCGV